MVALVKHRAVLSVRDMKEEDLPEVLEIEKKCFPAPWPMETFDSCLNSGCANLVGEIMDEIAKHIVIVAYMIYNTGHKFAHLENIAVAPEMQGQGFGRQLMERFTIKLSVRRPEISLEVRVGNKTAQLFFKDIFNKAGLVEVREISEFYENGEDAYSMICRYNSRNLGPLSPEIVAQL